MSLGLPGDRGTWMCQKGELCQAALQHDQRNIEGLKTSYFIKLIKLCGQGLSGESGSQVLALSPQAAPWGSASPTVKRG